MLGGYKMLGPGETSNRCREIYYELCQAAHSKAMSIAPLPFVKAFSIFKTMATLSRAMHMPRQDSASTGRHANTENITYAERYASL